MSDKRVINGTVKAHCFEYSAFWLKKMHFGKGFH